MQFSRITLLAGACFMPLLCASPVIAAESMAITTQAVATATEPVTQQEATDPRIAVQSFVEHLSYARVTAAMKNAPLAQQHIAQAREMAAIIKSAGADSLAERLQSGRLLYRQGSSTETSYIPITTGPVELKKIQTSPLWSEGVAVSDAEMVYLTLDLSDGDTDKRLNDAEAALKDGDYDKAQKTLAKLSDAVIKVEEKVAVPLEKARDNIALARSFIRMQNFDGARYALNHADDALDKLAGDKQFEEHRQDIVAIRKEVDSLKDSITNKDPSLMEKADARMEGWWTRLTGWGDR